MQPYFAPYAGYFRLAAACDVFVFYDCVQFPRRGWVHRNKLPDTTGALQWFTLPLEKAPQETAIKAMRFVEDSRARITAAARRFPDLCEESDPLVSHLYAAEGFLSGWLEGSLRTTCGLLGLRPDFLRSSDMDLPDTLKGQDRIIEIVKRLGGQSYVNAPGGRALYQDEAFRRHGLELMFLPPYQGDCSSILHRLRHEDHQQLASDIRRQSQPEVA